MSQSRLGKLAVGALIWALALRVLGAGGTRFTVDVFGTDRGLPQSSVLTLALARDGYMWAGTLNGLARFDGDRFTVFDESNTRGLSSSRVFRLFEDAGENLWIGTENAGIVLARKDGSVVGVDIGQGTIEGRLMAACQDGVGSVWLYTANGQLGRYNDKKVDVWRIGADRPSFCRSLVVDETGMLWVGTDWSLMAVGPLTAPKGADLPVARELAVGNDYLLSRRAGGFWRLGRGRIERWQGGLPVGEAAWAYPWRSDVHVSSACEDLEGNLIVGTYGDGVWLFDRDGVASRISGLSHSYIWSLLVDREGCLWVGTDGGGLNRVKRQVFGVTEGSLGSTVQSATPDKKNGVWIGYNGERVGHWNAGSMEEYSLHQLDLYVRAVLEDRAGRVWVATYSHGLFQLRDGKFERAAGSAILQPQISCLYEDRAGMIWAGTQGGLARWDGEAWKQYTTAEGLSANGVRAVAEDAGGRLWIGTDWGGLNCLESGKFRTYTKTNGLPSNNIASVYVDADGVIWVGTSGGLARFGEGHWTTFGKEQGLPGNAMGYLLDDGRGDLWVGTTAGLARTAKRSLEEYANGRVRNVLCRTYNQADGLPAAECASGSQPGACRTADGRLWFPTIRGLAWLDPAQLQVNTNRLPVVIESVLVEGVPARTNSFRAPPLTEVVLAPGKARLEVRYTSLNLAGRDRARFRYRMQGHETGWTETEAGSLPVAYYSKLPPGEYRFQVSACNEDGVWNETGAWLKVRVLPPFYLTWWFIGLMSAVLLGGIVGSVHYVSTQRLHRELEGMRQKEALEHERARIARDLHDQLGANLTQIALVGELAEADRNLPEEVESHAQQICQTARDTTRALDEIVWTVNPSNDTLSGLINYVCKYAQEYLQIAGVRYRVDAPAQVPATPISPELRHNVFLAAKEAITNVVRHARASAAVLRLQLAERSFTLEIEDNGKGLRGFDAAAAASRNGLRNMRKRMEDVGGTFSIQAAGETGAVVRLTAPLNGH